MKPTNAAAREFDQLHTLLQQLSSAVLDQLSNLEKSARAGDQSALSGIVARDRAIDDLELEVDRLARSFIELRAPLGPDFRSVTAAMDIARNLERIGDCIEYAARHIAAAAEMPTAYPAGWTILMNMLELCLDLLRQAHSAWTRSDVRLAARVPKQDDEIDSLQHKARSLMIDEVRAGRVDVALGLESVLIANKLESIADIGSHIAESVVFVIQARQIRHEKRIDPV